MSIKTRNGVPVEVEKKPMRFCAMIRCSTRKQATKGNSFENQSQIIENFVQAKGGEIIKTFQVQSQARIKLNKGVLAEVLTF